MIKSLYFKRGMLLLFCCSISIGLIAVLYNISEIPNTAKNGFNRRIESESGIEPDFYEKVNSTRLYFAGKTSNALYLGDYQQSNRIRKFDYHFIRSQDYKLSFSEKNSSYFNWVDSPIVYSFSALDSNMLLFILTNKDSPVQINKIRIPRRFTISLPLHNESYIFRTIDTSSKQNSLSKYTTNSIQSGSNNLLEKQGDGFFSTDGILAFDQSLSLIVYVYFYRNQFICLDTNIQLKYRANTIDTNRFSKLNIRELASNRLFTFSSPPIAINQKCTVHKGYLYIKSGLLADNENRQAFSKSSVIDIYDLQNGRYLQSFYIPAFDGYKTREFIITEKSLVAMQGPFIVHYPFALKFTQ